MRGVEGSAPMNAMTLAELIVIDPYFADCVLPLVHVGASLNHLGKKCFAFSLAARGSSMYCVKGEM
jgi:hypothetical protein